MPIRRFVSAVFLVVLFGIIGAGIIRSDNPIMVAIVVVFGVLILGGLRGVLARLRDAAANYDQGAADQWYGNEQLKEQRRK